MAIDRNGNGILDRDEPRPKMQIAAVGSAAVVQWPTNFPSYLLETAGAVPTTNWTRNTALRGVVDDRFLVTNAVGPSNLFFRLRDP
jgi:hypothetical protein